MCVRYCFGKLLSPEERSENLKKQKIKELEKELDDLLLCKIPGMEFVKLAQIKSCLKKLNDIN